MKFRLCRNPFPIAHSAGGDMSVQCHTLGLIPDAPFRIMQTIRAALLTICGATALSGIAQSKIHIDTTSLPDGFTGVRYSQALSASGGPTPLTWSFSTGSIPSGLRFNADGTITGTPAVTGSSTFIAQVQDRTGQTDTQQLSITVD